MLPVAAALREKLKWEPLGTETSVRQQVLIVMDNHDTAVGEAGTSAFVDAVSVDADLTCHIADSDYGLCHVDDFFILAQKREVKISVFFFHRSVLSTVGRIRSAVDNLKLNSLRFHTGLPQELRSVVFKTIIRVKAISDESEFHLAAVNVLAYASVLCQVVQYLLHAP